MIALDVMWAAGFASLTDEERERLSRARFGDSNHREGPIGAVC